MESGSSEGRRVPVRYIHATGFAIGGKGGNDAGVVLPADGAMLSDRMRLAVAAELGFSETVFVTALRAGARTCDVSLRYFTPTDEVELCGHATIACLGLLHERGLLGGARTGTIYARAGAVRFAIRAADAPPSVADDAFILDPDGLAATAVLPTQRNDAIYMQQLAPTIDAPLSTDDTAAVAHALFPALDAASALACLDDTWAPRVASTGLRDLMVAVHPECLYVMTPEMRSVAALSTRLGTVGMHAFCDGAAAARDTPAAARRTPRGDADATLAMPCDFRVRNFAPLFGINEESATGTSNCALACSLWASGVVPSTAPICFAQGELMAMPSRITVLPPAAHASSAEPAPVPPPPAPLAARAAGGSGSSSSSSSAAAAAAADAAASGPSSDMYRPWVGGEHALVGVRTVFIAVLPESSQIATSPSSSSNPTSPALGSYGGGVSGAGSYGGGGGSSGEAAWMQPAAGDGAVGSSLHKLGSSHAWPSPAEGGLSGDLSRAPFSLASSLGSPLSQPLQSAISNSLGISVPSEVGCPDCKGAKRGAWSVAPPASDILHLSSCI